MYCCRCSCHNPTHPIIISLGHFYWSIWTFSIISYCMVHVPWCQESQPFNALDMHEVTTAVESLYADELKPYGRILRKRSAEKAATMGYANLDVDIKRPMSNPRQNRVHFHGWFSTADFALTMIHPCYYYHYRFQNHSMSVLWFWTLPVANSFRFCWGLKSVCDTCPWIFVQAEEGGDWSALLQNRPFHNAFVDVYSPQDSYPLKMLGNGIVLYF